MHAPDPGHEFPRTPFVPAPPLRREVDQLTREGLLVNLLLDVFVPYDVPADRSVRATALAISLPQRPGRSRTVVTRRAAAWLWCGGTAPREVELARPVAPGRVASLGIRLHQCRFQPCDLVQLTELTVTTPARTAADLLRLLPAPQALEAVARLSRDTGVTLQQVTDSLSRMSGARGITQARTLVERWPPPAAAQSIRLPVTR